MFDELLAESAPFHGVRHRLLDAHAREPVRLDDEPPALVIEIVHDLLEPVVLNANEILHRNLDVGEGDVRGARGPHARALHLHALHAGHALLDQDHRQAVLAWPACAHRHREVVGEHPVGDPLLLAVDDEKLAGRVPVGAASQARDVAARVRLGDAQADHLLTLQTWWRHPLPELLGAEVKNRRQSDLKPFNKTPHHTTRTASTDLVDQYQLVEVVIVLRAGPRVLCRPWAHHPWKQPRLVRFLEKFHR
mmetsp:Transcript_12244/g.20694  ORF Transcript_12244/g.20694 Transcript_12244/m.20694 type:complete len:249 (+) Transcript_12244:590-1336(+)